MVNLVLAATEPVQTRGVNLAAVLAIVLPIASVLIALVGYLDVRSSRREARRETASEKLQNNIKTEITDSVNHLSEVLLERLETKEAVSAVRTEVAKMGVEIGMLKDEVRKGHGSANPT